MLHLPKLAKQFLNAYVVDVTPAIAEAWLANNNHNRNFNHKEVETYLRILKSGKWRRTHQAVAFDRNDILLDGQHRLRAIILSGMTVPVLVVINEDPENHEAIDCGKKRTPLDAMKLELHDSRISQKHIIVLRAMLSGRFCIKQGWSNIELNELYRVYGEAVQFVMDTLGDSRNVSINDAVVRGVIARAWYRIPQDRLVQFCDILRTGYGDHVSTECVCKLRNWLFSKENQREETRRDVYNRTQYTLQAFLFNLETVKVPLYPTELFPLPSLE